MVSQAVLLVESQHCQHSFDDFSRADRADDFQGARHCRRGGDPASGDEVVEIADVIAVEVSEQNEIDEGRHDTCANQTHDACSTTVDDDVMTARSDECRRPGTVRIWQRASGAQKCDLHFPSVLLRGVCQIRRR